MNVSKTSTTSTHQIVDFNDSSPSWEYEVKNIHDSTVNYGATQEMSLQDFFQRPIKIQSGSWVINATTILPTAINPWALFFENKRVMNRINNYSLLRAKLCVKVVINGTPFHFGKAILSYQPLHTFDSVSQPIRTTPVLRDLISLTQRPHVILDPSMDHGACMSLPFFWHKNWVNVISLEWQKLGQLRLDVMVPLAHANDGTGDVTYSIYAWAEDVVLSAPTSLNIVGLVAQSGEYNKGIISKTASNIAQAMGMLKEIPVIGNYAKATSMVANTTATVARQFGYSRPTILTNVSPIRPVTYGNVANTDADELVSKLTLDSKQELSIDPNIVGLNSSDEMTLKSIFSRPSYYTQFTWTPAAIQESLLFSTAVSPILYDYGTSATADIQMTPMCFASVPFEYWSGSIDFRFMIVATQYHKGRIKIVYEPAAITTPNVEYNTAFTKIVDISSERDFKLNVAWAQDISFCTVPMMSALNKTYSTTTNIGLNKTNHNGTLSVFVVTELTSPATTPTNVSIVVYVNGGEDFKLAVPTSKQLDNYSYFPSTLQTGELVIDNPNDAHEINGIVEHSSSSDDHLYDVHFGEVITSFRNLLKRYIRYHTYSVSIGYTGFRNYKVTHPNYPIYYGPTSTGIHTHTLGTSTKFNIVYNSPLNFLLPAYQAFRGSIRYKLMAVKDTANDLDHVTVTRSRQTNIRFSLEGYTIDLTSQTKIAGDYREIHDSMWDGAAINTTNNGTTLEFELPHYSPYRFFGAKNITQLVNEISPGTPSFTINGRDKATGVIHQHTLAYATGEDFSMYFYTGPPIIYPTVFINT